MIGGLDGSGNFFSSVKIAQLALKHRENKNQRQRIMAFVGHPVPEDQQKCEELGRRLKMNNVAIDIINFSNPANESKLSALVTAASKDDNCHFLNVPSGSDNLQGVLFSSSIFASEFDAPAGAGIGGAMPSGDADMDSEMAKAIELSL